MRIPAYWSKATAEDVDWDGKKALFSCWRSSDRSQEDAHESALAAAKKGLRSFFSGNRPGRYAYGDAPLREETVETFTNSRGTGRRGDAQLLRLPGAERRLGHVHRLGLSPDIARGIHRLLLRKVVQQGGSVSRGSAGSRRDEKAGAGSRRSSPMEHPALPHLCGDGALATHDLFDPASETTLEMLRSVGSDPLYVRLCKAQKCFRARLTPKPWRCGLAVNPVRWPTENRDQQAQLEKWQSEYTAKQARYATCRFLGTLGNDCVHPEAAKIIEVHDRITRCGEPLELA